MPDKPLAPLTQRIATWAAGVSYEDLPLKALEKSKQGILDTIGVTLAGTGHDASARAGQVVDDLAGQSQATIIGSTHQTSVALAAWQNAYTAHVLDFDDTHFDAIVHVNAPVTAAALAVAEFLGGRGRDLLIAHVVGLEVTSRVAIAAAAQPNHGWHLTGTAGTLGAAVTASRLLGLDATQTTHAIGIASTLSSGLRGHRGTMTKAINPANAAHNGIVAAMSARRGMTASTVILEDASLGYFISHGAPHPQQLADELGTRFRMLDWDPKPYPCGVVIHPAIDAALALLDGGLDVGHVDKVLILVNPLALSITGNPSPKNGLESKFSVFHAAATALLAGAVLPRHFDDEWVTSAEVIDLRTRFTGIAVEDTPRDQAEIVATLRDGTTVRATAKARGTRDRRMTLPEVENKFMQLSEPLLGATRTQSIIKSVNEMENLGDAGDLVRQCAVKGENK